jgi:Transposase DDE domain group 1
MATERGTLQVSKGSGWSRWLKVAADGKGLVGHAGVVLPRRAADVTGLTGALSAALASPDRSPGWDRGQVLVDLACAIVLGATSIVDVEVLRHQAALFPAPSDATVRRALDELDDKAVRRIVRARRDVRGRVWALLAARPEGFPQVSVAGRVLSGWVVVDADATVVTAASAKQGATGTFKGSFGFHPLGAWIANTGEAPAMVLRPGNAGSNTVADHVTVLKQALAGIPVGFGGKVLIRIDGAGASHELMEQMISWSNGRRTVRFVCGWTITAADEDAVKQLPAQVWTAAVDQAGDVQDGVGGRDLADVAELTGLSERLEGWPPGLRLIVRRSRPSRRHTKKLTEYEKASGWRYQVTATNITRMAGVPGSHHPFFADVLYRQRGGAAEHGVRTGKAMGLTRLPSKCWNVNAAWMLAANIANDLHAYTRLLAFPDHPELERATPNTMRFKILHLPARLVRHSRRRILRIPPDWPWAGAFIDAWACLDALPEPT